MCKLFHNFAAKMNRKKAFILLLTALCLNVEAHVETVSFADETAKRICVEQWDNDGDGELSYQEAAGITDLASAFCLRLLNSPVSFNELQYFTSLREISPRAFADCYKLRSITMPVSVQIIHEQAFSSCVQLEEIQIPTSVQRLEQNCFFHCSSLREILVPPSVRDSIPYQAFAYCTELQRATIEANVSFIGVNAFSGCSQLQTVTLPFTTTRVCSNAFSGCGEIRQIFCRASTPPAVGNDVFDSRVLTNAVLFVPEGSVEAYKQAPGWCDFKFISETFE